MRDAIPIPASELDKPRPQAVANQIEEKYSNRVLIDIGLCICLFEICELGDSLMYQSDSAVHVGGPLAMSSSRTRGSFASHTLISLPPSLPPSLLLSPSLAHIHIRMHTHTHTHARAHMCIVTSECTCATLTGRKPRRVETDAFRTCAWSRSEQSLLWLSSDRLWGRFSRGIL